METPQGGAANRKRGLQSGQLSKEVLGVKDGGGKNRLNMFLKCFLLGFTVHVFPDRYRKHNATQKNKKQNNSKHM